MLKCGYCLKTLIVFYVFVSCCFGTAQNLVGIQNHTISVAPGYTVANGTPITITGNVINNGTATLSGTLAVNWAVDTSLISTPQFKLKPPVFYSLSGLLPGAIKAFTISTVAEDINDFRVNGNGTTVVVWPFINNDSTTTADSSFTTVTITVTANTKELKNLKDIIITNPIHSNAVLIYDDHIYDKPTLINAEGIPLNAMIVDKTIVISEIPKGIYYIRFYNKVSDKYFLRKLIIN